MNSQVTAGVLAVALGTMIGVLLFVPFVAIQYRRHGRLTLRQLVLWSAFLVYGVALWTYTLLPLPASGDFACRPAQTTPLSFLFDIRDYPHSSVGALLHNPAVMQVALNVLLFVPLGFFIRMIWRRGVVVSTLVGFAISLAIECTQGTGVWGLYPCAYRLFDVDDLLANTAGAFAGGVLSIALKGRVARLGEAQLDAVGPTPVTFWRRSVGMLCDALAFWLLAAVAGIVLQCFRVIVLGRELSSESGTVEVVAEIVPLVAFGVLAVVTGRTLGDMAVQITWRGGVRPLQLRGLLRFVGGIGGWQALAAFTPGLDSLFLLVTIIALIATPRRGGLPGLVSGNAVPVDVRAVR
ncbi:VanZ family protein [Microbacterium halophytorum]|uniref:VanZ family protein n=1 Tax=Microbacterium halophytorum TaxID=2067568 RepID=UPI000CFD9EA8|nr:VanZ family protein [Microbacterium halophytorum]